jgi:hypothetical protein
VTGDYNEPFPTGIVEKTSRLSIELKGFIGKYLFADVETGIEDIRNFGHIQGVDRTTPFVNLRISTFFAGSVKVQ